MLCNRSRRGINLPASFNPSHHCSVNLLNHRNLVTYVSMSSRQTNIIWQTISILAPVFPHSTSSFWLYLMAITHHDTDTADEQTQRHPLYDYSNRLILLPHIGIQHRAERLSIQNWATHPHKHNRRLDNNHGALELLKTCGGA